MDVNSRRSKNRTPNWNSTQATKKKTTAERKSLCLAKKKPSTREGKTAVIAVFFFFFCCFCIQFNSFPLERRGTEHCIYNANEADEERELQTFRENTANKQWIPNYSVVAGEIVSLEVCSRNSAYVFFGVTTDSKNYAICKIHVSDIFQTDWAENSWSAINHEQQRVQSDRRW